MYKVVRHIQFFAKNDVVGEQKLLEFFTQKSIDDFIKCGYLQELSPIVGYGIDSADGQVQTSVSIISKETEDKELNEFLHLVSQNSNNKSVGYWNLHMSSNPTYYENLQKQAIKHLGSKNVSESRDGQGYRYMEICIPFFGKVKVINLGY